jgi:hypothetical protein
MALEMIPIKFNSAMSSQDVLSKLGKCKLTARVSPTFLQGVKEHD